MALKDWSKTASSNTSASPNGFPEGMAPSGVNDSAREVMAQVRTFAEDAQWFDFGDVPTRIAAGIFTIPSSGTHTAAYHINRRLRLANGSSTFYGAITDQTFAGGVVTVSVSLSAGALTTSLSGVAVASLAAIHPSYPKNVIEQDLLPGHGQGKLSKSGSLLVLAPFNGNRLIINNTLQRIPDNGISLTASATGLLYIYAYIDTGAMVLEHSATSPAVQAGSGIKIKTGDATRSLVGMAYGDVGPAWTDSAAVRFVRSWFNDPGFGTAAYFTTTRGTTSSSYAEIDTEIRNYFLTWAGEVVTAGLTGSIFSDVGGSANLQAGIAFDGTTPEPGRQITTCRTNGDSYPLSVFCVKTGLSEGVHYATVVGKRNTGTCAFQGGTTPDVSALQCYVHK